MMVIIAGLMLAVVLVLLAGLAVMLRGGELNKRYGNKLMIARVSLQGLTLALVGLMFLFSKH